MRGVANQELTPELAFSIGRAGSAVLAHTSDRHKPVIIGRDTRLSGTMLEAAIVAGVTSVGRDALLLGVIPTPAVARVAVLDGAAAGIMISASHNPIADNGIKFFGSDGFKLSDDLEDEIESLVGSADIARPVGTDVGVARAAYNLGAHYINAVVEAGSDLSGMTIVVDAAFGAAYSVGPVIFKRLGARVVELHCESDGGRINVRCGATDLRPLVDKVGELIARGNRNVVGVAFDGDADRALFVDEAGTILSGDHVMLILGRDLHARSELPGAAVIGTVMSNIGLERALLHHGIGLERAPVGDRYVLERMRAGGYRLGGEQSGHIIDLRYNTTGDGPMTAVTLFSIAADRNATLHEMASELTVYPQVLINVKTARKEVLDDPIVRAAMEETEQQLRARGRLLVRASGTEPLIRVMIEGDDKAEIERLSNELAGHIARVASRMLA